MNPATLLINSLNNSVPRNLTDANLGIIVLVAAIIGLKSFNSNLQLAKRLESLGLFFTFSASSLFPWFMLQRTPVSILQFPWRLLGIASFCFALSASLIINRYFSLNNIKIFIILVVSVILSLGFEHDFLNLGNADINSKEAQKYEQIATQAVYTDYAPYQFFSGMSEQDQAMNFRTASPIHQHIALVNGHKTHLTSSQIDSGYNKITYQIDNLKPHERNTLLLPLMNYGHNYSQHNMKVMQTCRGTTKVSLVPKHSKQTITVYLKY